MPGLQGISYNSGKLGPCPPSFLSINKSDTISTDKLFKYAQELENEVVSQKARISQLLRDKQRLGYRSMKRL